MILELDDKLQTNKQKIDNVIMIVHKVMMIVNEVIMIFNGCIMTLHYVMMIRSNYTLDVSK